MEILIFQDTHSLGFLFVFFVLEPGHLELGHWWLSFGMGVCVTFVE